MLYSLLIQPSSRLHVLHSAADMQHAGRVGEDLSWCQVCPAANAQRASFWQNVHQQMPKYYDCLQCVGATRARLVAMPGEQIAHCGHNRGCHTLHAGLIAVGLKAARMQ